MSLVHASKRVTAGSILRGALLLLLRNWLLLIVSGVVLGLISLGSLYIGGHCFASALQGCAPDWVFAWLGATGIELTVAGYCAELTFDFALAVSLYVLYARTNVDPRHPPYISRSGRRRVRFFGRVAVYWLCIHVPYLSLRSAYGVVVRHVFGNLPDETTGPLLWLGWAVLAMLLLAYIHIRLSFYLASATYGSAPSTFLACWRSTRVATGRLFLAYLAVEIFSRSLYFAAFLVRSAIPHFDAIAFDILLWAQILTRDPVGTLGDVVVATIDAAWTTLLCAAVSIVAYREIVIANERAVDVFD